MNGVLGHFYALSRLNWAGDNLGSVFDGKNEYTVSTMNIMYSKNATLLLLNFSDMICLYGALQMSLCLK